MEIYLFIPTFFGTNMKLKSRLNEEAFFGDLLRTPNSIKSSKAETQEIKSSLMKRLLKTASPKVEMNSCDVR